jgi:hypothetical protein
MVTPPGGGQPQTQDLGSKVEDIVTAARPHLTKEESRGLEELLNEYEDIFAGAEEVYGRTNKLYHRINTGDARQIRQAPRRITLYETSGSKGDAPQNATTWGYRRIREPLVVPRRLSERRMGSVWITGS